MSLSAIYKELIDPERHILHEEAPHLNQTSTLVPFVRTWLRAGCKIKTSKIVRPKQKIFEQIRDQDCKEGEKQRFLVVWPFVRSAVNGQE